MKTCSKCKLTMSEEEFGASSSWCKLCKKNHENQKRRDKGIKEKVVPIINNDSKQCLKCMEILSLDKFSPCKRNVRGLGLNSYCKKCFTDNFRVSKEKARIATQKYRDKDRITWRASHRIHQFNRKHNIKVTSDGTVTKEFLEMLFKNNNCYYCKKECLEEEKTIEHIIALNKGGTHTSNNVTMCCSTCNFSKQDKSEEEFNDNR